MNVHAIKTRLFREGESLEAFIVEHIPTLEEGSILAVTSKIAALAEGRTASAPSETDREAIIRSESAWMKRTKWVWLTLKCGMLMANAGVDESNADGKLILLPKDSYKSAEVLRAALLNRYGIKNLGIVITDSRTMPLRAGVVGVALGYAGFKGIRDYRGKDDLFGRKFVFETTDVADSLATAAAFEMGEGSERQPLAVVTSANVEFADRVDPRELLIDEEDDMYRPLIGGGK